MKKMLITLLAGLILAAIPVMAMAHDGGRKNDGYRHKDKKQLHQTYRADQRKPTLMQQILDNHDRHEVRHHHKDKHHRLDNHNRHQVRHEVRHHRKDKHHRSRPVVVRAPSRPAVVVKQIPVPAVLLGIPPLVVHLDW